MIAVIGHWSSSRISAPWLLLAGIFLAISLLIPRVLAPVKRVWLKLAALLSIVISPIALGLAYVLAMVPVGLLIRLSGKDLLRLRREPSAPSYWIERESGSPATESLKKQF
jgi:Saxitoxin biosynthesis operon protein SxtJ